MKLYVAPEALAANIQLIPQDDILGKILAMERTLSEKPEDRFVWVWAAGDNEYVTTLAYDEWKGWDVSKREVFVQAIASIGHKAGIT